MRLLAVFFIIIIVRVTSVSGGHFRVNKIMLASLQKQPKRRQPFMTTEIKNCRQVHNQHMNKESYHQVPSFAICFKIG